MVNSDFTKGLKANRDPIRIISRIYKVNTVADREIQQVNCTQCFERFPWPFVYGVLPMTWLKRRETVNSYYQRHLTGKIPRLRGWSRVKTYVHDVQEFPFDLDWSWSERRTIRLICYTMEWNIRGEIEI